MRVKTARDAAASGILALDGQGDADRAESAQWDLDKGAASVADVLERLPAPDAHAESLHQTLKTAADALNAAVETLEANADAIDGPTVHHAREALRAAVEQSDAYLLEIKDR